MPFKAVLDTNVWVSALLNPRGAPARLVAAFRDGSLQVVVSAPLLEEIADVLGRPRLSDRYGITSADVTELLSLIEERSEHALLHGDIHLCRDPDDDMVIDTTVAGAAEYLVTGDDDLRVDPEVAAFLAARGATILTVSQILALLDNFGTR